MYRKKNNVVDFTKMDNIGISNAIIGFAQFARQKGLNVGIEDTFNALKAFDMGLYEDKLSFYFALKPCFAHQKTIYLYSMIFLMYIGTSNQIMGGRSLKRK